MACQAEKGVRDSPVGRLTDVEAMVMMSKNERPKFWVSKEKMKKRTKARQSGSSSSGMNRKDQSKTTQAIGECDRSIN